jgi:FkbM family methyltransferase
MYHCFRWTRASKGRNRLTAEYEPIQPYFLRALVKLAECEAFIDVGANIGAYSVLLSTEVSRIVAYEANKAAATEMRANLRLNGISAMVREAAVSDRAGELEFGVVSRLAGNNGAVRTSSAAFRHTTVVPAVTLDEDLPGFSGPIAMKIDVEGHERAVLEGARRTLAHNSCILQIEDFGGELGAYLDDFGYRQLIRLGPDHYFTNIAELDVIAACELAADAMISSAHASKSFALHAGDLALEVSGRTYRALQGWASGPDKRMSAPKDKKSSC